MPEDDDVVRRVMREMGRKGGQKRAAKLSAKARSESARKAAKARWDEYRRLHGSARKPAREKR